MLKRLSLAFAGLFAFVQAACAAGTIPYSLSQQFDRSGQVLSGGKLYLFRAGTTSTPQNCFQDIGLTIPLPNPVVLDAAGRAPQMFCADGVIKIRLVDKVGVTQVEVDNIQVIGPSGGGGGGGGGSVDPTTIIATGDIKMRYGVGTLVGYVRANGRTIGSATSGATERANADCQALFEYLWNTDINLVVSGGRGSSSSSDWVAGKTISLPDWRGRVLAGLDDMGSTAAGRLTSAFFGSSAVILGAAGGGESQTLTIAQMPAHTHPNTLTDPGHNHTGIYSSSVSDLYNGGANFSVVRSVTAGSTSTNTTGITINNASQGGGQAHPIVQPTMLATIYIKL